MHPSSDAATNNKNEIAKTFAKQFNHFEWEYLCSYIDQFRLLAFVCLLVAPIVFLYSKSSSSPK